MALRRQRALALVGAAALVGAGTLLPARAGSGVIEPATLSRGGDPAITFLVRDTIHDGALRVPATQLGVHEKLWNVRGGYLLEDWVQKAQVFRLVFVGKGTHAGEKRVIGRSRQMTVAVSAQGTRVVWTQGPNDLSKPTIVRVTNPVTGRLVAGRLFRIADVRAVTWTRVLLSRRGMKPPTTTVWWTYAHNVVRTVADRAALGADVKHDRIVLATGLLDSYCNRVAVLSHPRRTLWRSCDWRPHAWSPDGSRVVATHTYFDDVGTNRWVTLRDHDASRLGGITGRFAWDAAWEDNTHFLTLALGDSGRAAIIRCTVGGTCERASRLWDVGKATDQPNYIPPPVVLASN